MCGTYFDKICQIGLKPAPIGKCWLEACIVTCKLCLAVGLGFSQLRVHSVIPCLPPLATNLFQVGHLPCSAVNTAS